MTQSIHDIYRNSSRLEKSLTELHARETAYQEACENAAEKKHAYEMRKAKEFLLADGTVPARKATAMLACEKEHQDWLNAQAIKTFTYQKLKDAQGASSARQSILSAGARSDQGYANDKSVT